MMKEYGHLLADDPRSGASGAAPCPRRVRDVSELLAAGGPAARAESCR